MTGSKTLYVPIETKVRELHGKFFFAFVAAEKGFDVAVGGQHEIRDLITRAPAGIYMDKSIAETKRGWFRKIRGAGHTLCSWDEEGLVVFDADSHFRLRICVDLLKQTSRYFGWGPSEIDTIAERVPECRDKLYATGNPRFDMLRPELRGVYDPAVRSLREEYGRMLLVNTNFAFANFFAGPEKVREVYQSYSISEDPEFFNGWEEAQHKSLELFIGMLPRLSETYPDHTIVIRPHPSEGFALWEELAAAHDNLVVRADRNVYDWILASELLIHFNCTTGIEAFFLGVPAISYRAPGLEKFHQPLPNHLSMICNSEEELFPLVAEIVGKGDSFPKLADEEPRMEIVRRFITGMEGPSASDRIVDMLWEVELDTDVSPLEPEPPVPLIKRIWRKWLKVVRRPDPRDHAYYRHKFPGISLEEAEEMLSRFQSLTGRFGNLEILPEGGDCFWVKRTSV
jgi:surface carbohydrate biosynthesis protein